MGIWQINYNSKKSGDKIAIQRIVLSRNLAIKKNQINVARTRAGLADKLVVGVPIGDLALFAAISSRFASLASLQQLWLEHPFAVAAGWKKVEQNNPIGIKVLPGPSHDAQLVQLEGKQLTRATDRSLKRGMHIIELFFYI